MRAKAQQEVQQQQQQQQKKEEEPQAKKEDNQGQKPSDILKQLLNQHAQKPVLRASDILKQLAQQTAQTTTATATPSPSAPPAKRESATPSRYWSAAVGWLQTELQ